MRRRGGLLCTLLLACALLAPQATSRAQELIPVGTIPDLGAEWEIWAHDPERKAAPSVPFHWVVFRNKNSGDYLSLAALPPESDNKVRRLEFWSDTALEIFPHGLPVWTRQRVDATSDATNTVLGSKVAASRGQDVLSLSFVTETSGRENTMAHARVWVSRKGIVFLQHTSTSPITPEIVDDTMSQLLRAWQEVPVPKSP